MRIRHLALTLVVTAGVTAPLGNGLRAQESAADEVVQRTLFREYTCYIDGQVQQVLRADGLGNPCWPGFLVPYEGWEPPVKRDKADLPEPASQAETEGRATITESDAPVPPLGAGYGSNVLTPRTLDLRVREESPAMRDGIPIIERDRFWERSATADGRRVWTSSDVDRQPSLRGVGEGYRGSSGAALRSVGADRRVRAQEGFSQRSPRTPRVAPAPSSSATGTPRAAPKSSRLGKKGVEN